MAGLVRPKNFPIRQITDNKHDTGICYNPLRFPDHGGFTSASAWPKEGNVFSIEAPVKGSKSAEVSNRRLTE